MRNNSHLIQSSCGQFLKKVNALNFSSKSKISSKTRLIFFHYPQLGLIIILCFLLTACEKVLIPKLENTPQAVFDEMWRQVDKNYIYFDLKQVDWDAQYDKYTPLIKADMPDATLFRVCGDMLKELRDGHNVLQKPNGTNVYDFKDGFEVNFDLATIKKNYLNNDFSETGFYTYGILDNNIGYVHFANFSGARKIAQVLEFMDQQGVDKLIFDVRNNGGGGGAEDIVSYFIPATTNVGYTIEKTGKERQAISPQLSFIVEPANFYFDKPVALLTNRGSFSATSYFAAMMKLLPNVTLVGQITGGGGGGNATFRLQNDWVLSVSVSTFLDTNFEDIESGVVPDIEINNDKAVLESGVDEMLERALEVL